MWGSVTVQGHHALSFSRHAATAMHLPGSPSASCRDQLQTNSAGSRGGRGGRFVPRARSSRWYATHAAAAVPRRRLHASSNRPVPFAVATPMPTPTHYHCMPRCCSCCCRCVNRNDQKLRRAKGDGGIVSLMLVGLSVFIQCCSFFFPPLSFIRRFCSCIIVSFRLVGQGSSSALLALLVLA